MRQLAGKWAVLVAAAAVAAVFASAAGGYGGENGPHEVWQIGFSLNCNGTDPSLCPTIPGFLGPQLGGSWGWIEFDCKHSATNPSAPCGSDGTLTWGDGDVAICVHEVANAAGPPPGAFHERIDFFHWQEKSPLTPPMHIPYPSLPAFQYSANLTFQGANAPNGGAPRTVTNAISGFPTTPGHYSFEDLFGKPAPQGTHIDINVVHYFYNPQSP